MVYRVIGLMSGSSLDGLDIAYVEFQETGGKWQYEIIKADCFSYTEEWVNRLKEAANLDARHHAELHAEYGHLVGRMVNQFIDEHALEYKVGLIASHGHTSFHMPGKYTVQLGDGAAIAAETGLPVVSELRAMDVGLGGQGAPIVPMGEKLLFSNYRYFLNLGGIANISFNSDSVFYAFDVCAANRVMNMLSQLRGKAYDDGGVLASSGRIHEPLLETLEALDYYANPFPKSLDNSFGIDTVYPLLLSFGLSVEDSLATYAEHICIQVSAAVKEIKSSTISAYDPATMLVTGGGAFNNHLISRLQYHLQVHGIEIIVPDATTVSYKEALIMALLGVLRWREEDTVLSMATGSIRSSVGGALWMGSK